MTELNDRTLADWLADGSDRGFDTGIDAALATTRRTTQRPRWRTAVWWSPGFDRISGAVPTRTVLTVVLVSLLLLVAIVVFVAGSRQRLPAPFGVAGNGQVAMDILDPSLGAGVGIMDPASGSVRRLDVGEGLARTPTYSRDGTRFVFWTRPTKTSPVSLWVADADGQNAHALATGLPADTNVLFSPSWSVDDRWVVATVTEAGRIVRIATDAIDPPADVFPDDGFPRSQVSVSPDGRHLGYIRTNPGRDVELVISDSDGAAEEVLYQHVVRADGQDWIQGPVWAPDSSAVAFVTMADVGVPGEARFAGRSILTVRSLDGSSSIVASEPASREGQWFSWPGWSNDGTWIAYGTGEAASTGDIRLVHPDRTGDHSIWHGAGQGGGDCYPLWSPDATQVLSICPPYPLVPIADPAVAHALPLPSGVRQFDWQRRAP
jgi:Tol biopolymer transport system component